jgi:hypothetical protein
MGILEVNKQLVLRGIEAWNSGDLEAVARLTHPDFFDHGGTAPGPEARLEPLDIVAEDDRVVVRGRVARVGRPVQEIHIWRLAAGLIVEHWQGSDGPSVNQRDKEE